MSRLLIIGGSSYLGQHLAPLAVKAFKEVGATYCQTNNISQAQALPLDVCEATAVRRLITSFQPDVIIHTVGSNRGEDYERVIVTGTKNVVSAIKGSETRLVHLSTDCVFDGRNPPYDETAMPTPVNAYGRAKAQAETTAANHSNHVIVRTSLIYGLTIMDHGTRWIVQALKARQQVTLFENQVRQPIWAASLSQACLELTKDSYTGILNIAGDQAMTRADFALKLLDWWKIEERSAVLRGAGDGRKWPLNLTLNLSRANALLTTPLPGVDAVIMSASKSPHTREKNPI